MQRSSLTTRKLFLAIFLVVFLLLVAVPQLAAASPANPVDTNFGLSNLNSALPQTDLRVVIARIIQAILGVLGIILLLLILYAGFLWMTAAGEESKIEKAKKIMTQAIIGFIIILSAFSIVTFVLRILTGATFGGGPGTTPGGPTIDPGRWGIGRGPIESVYPTPGQTEVPINTIIAVTFKVPIKSDTICDDSNSDGRCDNERIKNVKICLLDNQNNCVPSTDPFGFDSYDNTMVASSDNKTFVFTPETYLGAEDKINRRFQVTLQEGVRSVQEPDRSVFNSLINKQYLWDFTTNGELDLDPPEIVDITGVYPYPDGEGDVYSSPSAPTVSKFNLTVLNTITPQVDQGYTQPSSTNPNAPAASLTGSYGGSASGAVVVSIDANNNKVDVNWPGGMNDVNNGPYSASSRTVNIGPYGLTFILAASPSGVTNWTFNVTASQAGDKIEILENNNAINTYILGKDIAVTNNATTDRQAIKNKLIASNIFEAGAGSDLQTKTTGSIANRYNLRFTGKNTPASVVFSNITPAQDASSQRAVKGLADPFRNTIFQVTFNEAINPLSITHDSIKVGLRQSDNTWQNLNNDQFVLEFSNQYHTVGLKPSASCGATNSCGDEMTCWPIASLAAGEIATSTSYSINLISSDLIDSADAKCVQWGGASDGHGRCQKTIGSKTVFYPLARTSASGLVDMSKNAFNGSFDYYLDNDGQRVGLAQGKSQNGNGQSGRTAYNLNEGIICSGGIGISNCYSLGNRVISYSSSTPIFAVSGFGDDFTWSFKLSSEIDIKAPLLKTISPVSQMSVSDRNELIHLTFDRLMRSYTIKPGWNYGSTDKDKAQRYIALETLTQNQIAVGYWLSQADRDNNNDGWAEYTEALISHNPFDPNVEYGPLSGSGVQSVTQNCFLPAGGPKNAAEAGVTGSTNACGYESVGSNNTVGCVRDADLVNAQVKLPNPASYGRLNCSSINGASVCDYNSNKICFVSYYNPNTPLSYLSGSWVISKDKSTADASGRTGCCFGQCRPTNDSNWKTCSEVGGSEGNSNSNACEKDTAHPDDKPGLWIITKGLASGNECCLGVMR